MTEAAVIWVDPGRRGGEPCITDTRITTRQAAQAVWESGIDDALECWPHVTRAGLLGACWFEARYGAPIWRTRWGTWLDIWGDAMWRSDWENVADPPRRSRGTAMTATVPRVARPRGALTPNQRRRLERSAEKREKAEAGYRAEVLAVMEEGASFAEVAKATGLSTNTLQRWKKKVAS